MLANPVVLPAYADPVIWSLAFVAIWAEVRTVLWTMRRFGSDVRGLLAPVFALNITTWFAFLIAIDRVLPWPSREDVCIALLAVAVVFVDAALLHSATHGRLFTRGLPCAGLTWSSALLVAFAGNVVSIALSLALPVALVALLDWAQA